MRLPALALMLGLVLGGALVAREVKYNFDKNADFGKYKTCRWEQHSDFRQVNQLTLNLLGSAFDAELAKKGLRRVAPGENADLVFVYQLAASKETQITSYSYSSGYGMGPGWALGAMRAAGV
jgi:hypothetical protein